MLLYAFICFTCFSHALKANVSQEQQQHDRGSLVYRLYLRKPVKMSRFYLCHFGTSEVVLSSKFLHNSVLNSYVFTEHKYAPAALCTRLESSLPIPEWPFLQSPAGRLGWLRSTWETCCGGLNDADGQAGLVGRVHQQDTTSCPRHEPWKSIGFQSIRDLLKLE